MSARGGRLRRRRHLVLAGGLDAWGFAAAWATVALIVTRRDGVAAYGLCQAALLLGVAASAPVVGVLAAHWPGRTLLRRSAALEAVLRFLAVLSAAAGWPLWAVALVVGAFGASAWTNHAAMRAEVSATGSGARVMASYSVATYTAEAAGAAMVALVAATTPVALVTGGLAALSMIPAVLLAAGSPILPAGRERWHLPRHLTLPLVAGGVLVFVASGPTILAIGLADSLWGGGTVAVAAVAFTAGSLLAPRLAGRLGRLPIGSSWPVLGAVMLAGWVAAAVHPALLVLAQLGGGLGTAAFEGDMDARVTGASRDAATAGLAFAGAVRGLGSAGAAALFPVLAATGGLPRTVVVALLALAVAAALPLVLGRGLPTARADVLLVVPGYGEAGRLQRQLHAAGWTSERAGDLAEVRLAAGVVGLPLAVVVSGQDVAAVRAALPRHGPWRSVPILEVEDDAGVLADLAALSDVTPTDAVGGGVVAVRAAR